MTRLQAQGCCLLRMGKACPRLTSHMNFSIALYYRLPYDALSHRRCISRSPSASEDCTGDDCIVKIEE